MHSPKIDEVKSLVQIQLCFTLVTGDNTPKYLVAAFRTKIAGFFILDPLFCTNGASMKGGPQDHSFPNGHGKIVDVVTGKIVTFMAPADSFFGGAIPDLTLGAMHE